MGDVGHATRQGRRGGYPALAPTPPYLTMHTVTDPSFGSNDFSGLAQSSATHSAPAEVGRDEDADFRRTPDYDDAQRSPEGRRRNEELVRDLRACDARASVIAQFATRLAVIVSRTGVRQVDWRGKTVPRDVAPEVDLELPKLLKHRLITVDHASGCILRLDGREMSHKHACTPERLSDAMRSCRKNYAVSARVTADRRLYDHGKNPMQCNAAICPACARHKMWEHKAKFRNELREIQTRGFQVWEIVLRRRLSPLEGGRNPIMLLDNEVGSYVLPPSVARAAPGEEARAALGPRLSDVFGAQMRIIEDLRRQSAWRDVVAYVRALHISAVATDAHHCYPSWTVEGHILAVLGEKETTWRAEIDAALGALGNIDMERTRATPVTSPVDLRMAMDRITRLSPALILDDTASDSRGEMSAAQLMEFALAMKGRRPLETAGAFNGRAERTLSETAGDSGGVSEAIRAARESDPRFRAKKQAVYRPVTNHQPNETYLPTERAADAANAPPYARLTTRYAKQALQDGKGEFAGKVMGSGELEKLDVLIVPANVVTETGIYEPEAKRAEVVRGRRRRTARE